ncbi:MAG: hypothetical protein KDC90_06425 [Ignavibacteriae bacterium]|nr:hypothetical protein [Ignavibacteriota bacterium]
MAVIIVLAIVLIIVFFASANKANNEQKEHIQNSGGILVKYDTFLGKIKAHCLHQKIYPVNQTTFVAHYPFPSVSDPKAVLHVQYVFGKTIVAWFYPLSNGGTDKIFKEFDESTDQEIMANWATQEFERILERVRLNDKC